MTWQECFEKYHYKPLIIENVDGNRSLDIGMFLKENKVPNELRQVYLSSKKDELFLIIQPSPATDVKSFCKHWDDRIMSFINFGCLPDESREVVEGLRYNITQILLYGSNIIGDHASDIPLMSRPDSFLEEKSVSVSRKIFLLCGKNDMLNDESRMTLPFWYDELEETDFNFGLEEKLYNLLPHSGLEVCLCRIRTKVDHRNRNVHTEQLNFTDEDFDAVKGWLNL